MPSIPLRYRLPNAPADFVGRQSELKSVGESLRDAQVTVISGPGGVGKSALALASIHKRFPKRVKRTLYVGLPRQVDGLEARQELLRALAVSTNTEIGWAHLQDDPDALIEAALDLAEEHSFWMLVEDLHHLPSDDAEELVEQLSRYARTSRYLFTTRRAARPEAGSTRRVIEVTGLDDAAALELAKHIAKSRPPEALAEAVRSSGGSPWLLREALTGITRSDRSSTNGEAPLLFEGLDEPVQQFARLAASLELSVPASDLSAASGVPETVWRAPLEARGWLEEGPAGVHLHEVAALGISQSEQLRAPPELWLPMARALTESSSTAVRLEALRLLIAGGDFDSAEALLDRDLPTFLAEGYAPKLWKLLMQVPEERLAGARLRCAAELGSPTVLRQVPMPLGGQARDRLTWAETQYMKGDVAGALDALSNADAAVDESEADASELRFDAALLRARILMTQDRTAEATALLSALHPESEEDATRRDAIAASIVESDPSRLAETLTELASLEWRCTALGARDRALSRFHVALAYFRADALDRAEAALGALVTAETVDTLALFETRRAAWLHALLDIARGRLDSAQKRLDLLEPFLHAPSLIRADVFLTRARLWMARGELGEVQDLISRARTEAESLGLWATERRAAALAEHAADLLLSGDRPTAPGQKPAPAPRAEDLTRLVAEATASGNVTRAAELRSELCAVLLSAEQLSDFERELGLLRTAARQMSSMRFTAESDLLAMARDVDLARLEAIAAHPELSPVAARRARVLLGDEQTPTDELDRAVVARVAMPALELVLPATSETAWEAGWGVDLNRKRVWLPSGEWIDLSRRALHLRLLTMLARHGGAASKETIVREVWDEREYHPLRHDSRLQVTVHKLRDLLEDDPKVPERLLTTSGGYGLSAPFRLAGSE